MHQSSTATPARVTQTLSRASFQSWCPRRIRDEGESSTTSIKRDVFLPPKGRLPRERRTGHEVRDMATADSRPPVLTCALRWAALYKAWERVPRATPQLPGHGCDAGVAQSIWCGR
ncbi:hypothetical protein BKA81DRAFT_364468 [Phyllosticta paracitricarpa]